jgi:hypothetical protein
MAKPLVLEYAGKQLAFDLNKVSRDKLYGYKETEACDDLGRRCEMVTLAEDGRTLVGRGGVALGYVSADRAWCDKSQLAPVNSEGEPLTPCASSFNAPISLTERTSTDRYLEHNIRAVYHLSTTDEVAPLCEELNAGAIFSFSFSYRGGLDPDTAFLLTNAAGELFLALGKPVEVRFLDLKQSADLAVDDTDDQDEESDLMDFEMM